MAKDLEISRLCDAYGALLTDNMLRTVREYYDYDLSLAEIGEECGVTRQAVLSRLQQAEKKLREYEQAIGIVQKTDKVISRLQTVADGIPDGQAKTALDSVITDLKEWRY
ncbi:MAG: DNA-binding protein [Clostridiales bacterium]|nr:DNA-binding protein [Clostridiales bacterium]